MPQTKLVGSVWKNQDFRVDVGRELKSHPNVKTWELQVNRETKSNAANSLTKEGRGTHKKPFHDMMHVEEIEDVEIDVEKPIHW